jgi:hypothetical protein
MATRVFISYSRHDKDFKDQLLRQLSVLERQDLVATWSDERIDLGADWYSDLIGALASASIVVLLITADFLSSEFILREEVPRALQQRRANGLQVIPVYCRPCPWDTVPWLASLQIWPRSGLPLWKTLGDDATNGLNELAREIARLVSTPIPNAASTLDAQHADTADIERQLPELTNIDPSAAFQGIVAAVKATIAVGAPIYNRGDKAQCAAIYFQCVTRLAELLELAPMDGALGSSLTSMNRLITGGPMSPSVSERREMPGDQPGEPVDTLRDPRLVTAAQQELRTALHFSKSQSAGDGDELAWHIRHTFDRLILLETGAKTLRGCFSPAARCGHSLLSVVNNLDQIADTCELKSDEEIGVAVHTAATLASIACSVASKIAKSDTLGGFAAHVAQTRLERAIAGEKLTLKSAARVLWVYSSALRCFSKHSA